MFPYAPSSFCLIHHLQRLARQESPLVANQKQCQGYVLTLMLTTIFNLDRRGYTLQSVMKVFRIFDPLAAQTNQLRNLIERRDIKNYS